MTDGQTAIVIERVAGRTGMALYSLSISEIRYFHRLCNVARWKSFLLISVARCAACQHPFGVAQSIWEPCREEDGRLVHRYCHGLGHEWGEYPPAQWLEDGQYKIYWLGNAWKPVAGPERT